MKMHLGRFMLSLSVGSVPVGFALAWGGEATVTGSRGLPTLPSDRLPMSNDTLKVTSIGLSLRSI